MIIHVRTCFVYLFRLAIYHLSVLLFISVYAHVMIRFADFLPLSLFESTSCIRAQKRYIFLNMLIRQKFFPCWNGLIFRSILLSIYLHWIVSVRHTSSLFLSWILQSDYILRRSIGRKDESVYRRVFSRVCSRSNALSFRRQHRWTGHLFEAYWWIVCILKPIKTPVTTGTKNRW